jgi:hypothetical protein
MPLLRTQPRQQLQNALKQACRLAESVARFAAERLMVGSVDEPPFRNRLRVRGERFGDRARKGVKCA